MCQFTKARRYQGPDSASPVTFLGNRRNLLANTVHRRVRVEGEGTQGVTMTRSRNTEMADFQIEQSPPEHTGAVKLLSEPRQTTSIKSAIYAFGGLFRS